jgi:hypothetical protein
MLVDESYEETSLKQHSIRGPRKPFEPVETTKKLQYMLLLRPCLLNSYHIFFQSVITPGL